ncbi:hypothetical protein RSOLAG1IB_06685 [Rhizoctonia solani AG-1 IB]|uniref:G domain-containing protein n=1 Tax=Thanatephorus cucumeris (strain AG1-IB / isolate 7/3/14) TaxID=1108050 RepID=A0A0B7FCH7_THACB|nr:hypothetical protein RSOLAG1IB_06685 [Rhizoctonia solani AG-1 IB]
MLMQDTKLEPRNVLVFGPTGTGKTTIINHLTSSTFPIGDTLKSCTKEIQYASAEHQGCLINYFDTPGFDDSTMKPAEQLAQISLLTSALYEACGRNPNIHGVLYVHRITDNRMPGSTLRNLRVIKHLLGPQALSNLVFVTNMWDSQPDTAQIKSEEELINDDEYFASAMEHGARAGENYRVFKGATQAQVQETLSNLFLNTAPVVLQIQRDLVDEEHALKDIDAGRIVDEAIDSNEKETGELIKELKEELANASGAKEARIKSKLDDANNRAEQAKKQRGFLQLTLKYIRDHPYLSALIVVTVVAAGAGVIMFGGKLVRVFKLAWKAIATASGAGAATASGAGAATYTVSGAGAATATGVGVATGVEAGTVDVSAKLNARLIALLGTAVGVGVITSKDARPKQDEKVNACEQ